MLTPSLFSHLPFSPRYLADISPLAVPMAVAAAVMMPLPPRRETREKELRELRDATMQYGDANEVLNSRAVEVRA